MVKRFNYSFPLISRVFKLKNYKLSEITFETSDIHFLSSQVVILEFEVIGKPYIKRKIVYKPSSVHIDFLLNGNVKYLRQ